MGLVQKISKFLIGALPSVYDKEGNVTHKLSDKKWKDWEARYLSSADYNWRSHTGRKHGGIKK